MTNATYPRIPPENSDIHEMNRKLDLLLAENAEKRRKYRESRQGHAAPAQSPVPAYQGLARAPVPDLAAERSVNARWMQFDATRPSQEPVFHIELLTDENGYPVADSLGIATRFGKNHYDVLRAIDDLVSRSERAARNFAASEYRDGSGKSNRMFLINRDGFCFLVMGFTGSGADEWKWAYIDAFNRMEAKLREPQRPKSTLEMLEEAVAELKAKEALISRKEQAISYMGSINSVLEDELAARRVQEMTTEDLPRRVAAKVLGQRPGEFDKWLEDHGFISKLGDSRRRYVLEPVRTRGFAKQRYYAYMDKHLPDHLRWHDEPGYKRSAQIVITPTGMSYIALQPDLPRSNADRLQAQRQSIRHGVGVQVFAEDREGWDGRS